MKFSAPGLVLMLFLAVISGCASTSTQDAAKPSSEASASEATVPTEESEPLTNKLKWSTASEVDNFGYDIYRSTSEDGPFTRITKDPIPGAGTTDEPSSYVYIDDTNDPALGYYYYIESISMQGVRERFSPISYVGPKRPAQAEEEDEDEDEEP